MLGWVIQSRLNRVITRNSITMGNICTQDPHMPTTSIPLPSHFTTEKAQLADQDYDNPHRHQLSSKFLQTNIDASNHLMEIAMVPRRGSRQLSAFWNETVVESERDGKMDGDRVGDGSEGRSRGKFVSLPSVKICYGDFVDVSKKKIEEKYRILEKVGAGAYGEVYKAEHQNGDIRAIKIFRSNQLQKHLQQIQILKQCDHPNIIQIYQLFAHQNSWHIVMEYCQGGSIINLIKQKKYLYLEHEAQIIVEQILHALNYLHGRGIVHRDIKLENVVFVRQREGDCQAANLKIIDFGNAVRVRFKVNKSNVISGTTVYMPPEAFSGWYSYAFDIWSCGVMLCILLTGSCPFKRSTKQQIIEAIKTSQLDFTEPKWSKVSEQAKELIKRMLDKDFTKRPSAQECLRSSWFGACMKRSQLRKASEKFTKNLTKYYAINNFVSVVESYLSFLRISHSQKNEIKKLFQAIDTKRQGRLHKADLLELYKNSLDLDPEMYQKINLLLQAIDKNKSGYIEYSEFQALMSDRQKLFITESLGTAFDYFDVDGSGYIERNQLIVCLKDCEADVEELIREIDRDRDQRISREEFVRYFLEIQSRLLDG